LDITDIERRQYKNNIYALPPGHHVTHQKQPSSPNDLMNYMKHNEHKICAVFQIPRLIVIHDETRTENSSKTAQDSYRQTVNTWRNRFSEFVTWMYTEMYGDSDRRKYHSH
jgi:hypothetical protein